MKFKASTYNSVRKKIHVRVAIAYETFTISIIGNLRLRAYRDINRSGALI